MAIWHIICSLKKMFLAKMVKEKLLLQIDSLYKIRDMFNSGGNQ